jgi:hypothetical protein
MGGRSAYRRYEYILTYSVKQGDIHPQDWAFDLPLMNAKLPTPVLLTYFLLVV